MSFYATPESNLTTLHSRISGDRVYSGHYWDEFQIPALLAPEGGRVTVLGVARGAHIRACLAANPSIDLRGVDSSPEAIQLCDSYHKQYFPNLRFMNELADAETFATGIDPERSDVIFADLYTDEGAAACNWDEIFLQNLKRNRLLTDGYLVANLFGVPSHLRPLSPDLFAGRVVHLLKRNFKNVWVLPYRRNLTVIASDGWLRIRAPGSEATGLNLGDRLSIRATRLRLNALGSGSEIPYVFFGYDPIAPDQRVVRSFEDFQTKMHERWPPILKALNQILDGINSPRPRLEKPRDLLPLLQSEELESILEACLEKDTMLVLALSNLIAGESNYSNLNLEAYLRVFLNAASRVSSHDRDAFIHLYLPQFQSLLCNSRHLLKAYLFRFQQVLNRLEVRDAS